MKLLTPDWPLPDNVQALISTRQGGVSPAPWDAANFGLNSGDCAARVQENRLRLQQAANLVSQPQWLRQVHGNHVVDAVSGDVELQADAVVSRHIGLAVAVLTADCLPVLFCDRAGSVVAAAHAGWRGLAAGVLRNTVESMKVAPDQLLAYLGPAISQPFFEVGPEVQQVFAEQAINSHHRQQIANSFIAGSDGRQQADLCQLARAELYALGLTSVYGGEYCTCRQQELFYSYRRDGVTGRLASLIWLVDS